MQILTCALFKVGNKSQEDYLVHQSKDEEARAEKKETKLKKVSFSQKLAVYTIEQSFKSTILPFII